MTIVVMFYFKKGKEDITSILTQINITNSSFADTRIGYVGKFPSFFYKIKKVNHFHRMINSFRSEFKNIFTQIEITTGSEFINYNYINDKAPKLLSESELESFINIFQLKLLLMDVGVINRVLFEGITEEYKDIVDDLATNGFDTLVKLLYNQRLNKIDIQDIIKMLPDNDDLFCSQIVNLIIERSDIYSQDTIEKIYKNEKGKDIKVKRKSYFKNLSTQNKLESFFKYFILEKSILEHIEYQAKLNPKKIRVQIQINPENYNYFKLKNSIINEIKNCFYKHPYETLKTFKKILFNEIERDNTITQEIEIVISYDYDLAKDQASLEKIYYDKWNEVTRNIQKGYCILTGAFQKRDVFIIKPSWRTDIEFLLKDKEKNTEICIINRNMEYFRDIIENIKMDETLEIQGFLLERIEKKKFQGFDFYVIDIKILKHFEAIEVDLGANYLGKRKLYNTLDGVKLVVSSKKAKIPDTTPILDVPIDLRDLWIDKNKETSIQNIDIYYEVELNGAILFDTKMKIIKYIDEKTPLSYVRYADLKRYIGIIFQEYIKRKTLVPKHMFPTVGVFDIKAKDGKKKLVVVHPFKADLRTFGHNAVQKRLVERIKAKGLDKNGDMAKVFYDIIHLDSIEEWVRFVILGFSASSPYAYAIRSELDVFGNLFIIGPSESGKSISLLIFMNYLYGTELKSPENIDSNSRLTFYSTEGTTPSNWDDIDDMEDAIAFIKSNSTFKGTRDRNTTDQQMVYEQTYPCFTGSANEKDWLSGKDMEAFRSRCFIIELTDRLDYDPNFEKLFKLIKDGPIFGFNLLEKGIELADNLYPDEITTNYEKFIQLFIKTKKEIIKYGKKYKIKIRSRRSSMYSLLYIGWKIWNYIWLEKGLESPILKKLLDLENKYFCEIIQELEEKNQKILLEDIENIVNYFETEYIPIEMIYIYDGKPVLLSSFVSDFDKYARMRGYNTLGGKCKDLLELQNDILSKQDKIKTYNCDVSRLPAMEAFNGQGQLEIFDKKKVWGVLFHYQELCKLFGKGSLSLTSNDASSEDYVGKIDMDRVFIGQSKSQFNKFLNRLKEISEANEGADLELDSLVQLIDVAEGDLTKKFIEEALIQLIKEGTINEIRPGYIKVS